MVFAGVLAVVVGAVAVFKGAATPRNEALAKREHIMESLGISIAKLRPQCKVLVLSNPFTKTTGYLNEISQFERAGLHGLRKGLGSLPVTVVFPEIRPQFFTDRQSIILPPNCRTPLSFVIEPGSLDSLADAHPECNVIVSLIGLPVGTDQLKIWGEKDPRSFAMLMPDLSVLEPPAKAVEDFQRGKLLAAVAEDNKTKDALIITRDNVAAVLETQPIALGY